MYGPIYLRWPQTCTLFLSSTSRAPDGKIKGRPIQICCARTKNTYLRYRKARLYNSLCAELLLVIHLWFKGVNYLQFTNKITWSLDFTLIFAFLLYCEQPTIVCCGLQLHKAEEGYHVCFNLSHLCSGSLSDLCCTLAQCMAANKHTHVRNAMWGSLRLAQTILILWYICE